MDEKDKQDALYKALGADAKYANPHVYDPTQKTWDIKNMGAIYKGGIIKDVHLDTGLRKLMELEKKVYGEQFYGSNRLIRKLDEEVTTGYGAGYAARGWLEVAYGRKCWTCLNYEANVFALLPKEPWDRTGYRIETAEAGDYASGGVKEKGLLPDTEAPEWQEIQCRPKTVMHGFDLSELAEFISKTGDDALDILPVLRTALGNAHRHHINEQLTCNVTNIVPAATGFESIDRVVSSFSEVTLCGDVNAGDSDICNIDRDAAASACFDAYVDHNSNVDRDLTLALIDTCLQNVWQNGGDTNVLVTGYDTLFHWAQLLEAERRFMEVARVIPTFGGVRGPYGGVEGGFFVSTYMGKPILPTQDCVRDTISRIYFLDTADADQPGPVLGFATAKPTRYMETGFGKEMIYTNILGMEGWYETIGELRCHVFNRQAKLRDLR